MVRRHMGIGPHHMRRHPSHTVADDDSAVATVTDAALAAAAVTHMQSLSQTCEATTAVSSKAFQNRYQAYYLSLIHI